MSCCSKTNIEDSKILIIGASGMVGSHLLEMLKAEKYKRVFGTYYTNELDCGIFLDISNRTQTQLLLSAIEPDIIFLTGAQTDVDLCEEEREDTDEVNIQGVKNVVDFAGKAKIVFFSSDYIFDGENGPYDEFSTPNPINVYGKQKLIAEHYALSFADSIIVRASTVYGPIKYEKGFLARLVNSLNNKTTCGYGVRSDVFVTPTYAGLLAVDAVASLYINNAKPNARIFHSANTSGWPSMRPICLSKFDFAKSIIEEYNKANLKSQIDLNKLTSTPENTPAKRPLKGGLMRTEALNSYVKAFPVGLSEGIRAALGLKK